MTPNLLSWVTVIKMRSVKDWVMTVVAWLLTVTVTVLVRMGEEEGLKASTSTAMDEMVGGGRASIIFGKADPWSLREG